MEDDTFGKIVILTFEDTEEQIMNRILSYLDRKSYYSTNSEV